MKTNDLFKTTPAKINESLHKTFGKKINFESFDQAKLEDARNKLRTQVHQFRSNSKFNENLDNDAYHEAQWMLDAINAELAEREEQVAEGSDVDENTVRELLKQFDNAANDMRVSGDVNPETVIRHLEQGDVEAAIEAVTYQYAGPDGEEPGRGFDDLVDELEEEFQELIEYENDDFDFRQEYDDDDPMDYTFDDVNESEMKVETKINEGEVDQASAIVTANSMVDKIGRWIEELSGMENDTLLSLGDSIRDEMGQEQAKRFLSSAAPAIEDALNHLKSTRDEMTSAVRVLTGEETGTDLLGDEPSELDIDEPELSDGPLDLDDREEDDFETSEPAVGGIEPEGRAQRESVENIYRILAG